MAEQSHGRPETCVHVVYALPEVQHVVEVAVTQGMTAADAVARSGLIERFPDIAEQRLVLGLFGRQIDERTPVGAGDRVEICRPLLRDPRDLRRDMTAQGRVVGQRRAQAPTSREPVTKRPE
jgi:putative ubiquitin-RnfH superfamily antitoxin RatB of RatAB toxin-antitoxin module